MLALRSQHDAADRVVGVELLVGVADRGDQVDVDEIGRGRAAARRLRHGRRG
jgi:hypothetical protein